MLEKNRLKLSTTVWLFTCLAAFFLFFGNIYFTLSENILLIPIENSGLSSEQSFQNQLALFVTQYFVSSLYIAIALVIFWKKPNSWVVVVVSLVFLSYGTTEVIDFGRFEDPIYSSRFWIINTLQAFGEWLSLIIFFIFPNGKFEPRWTKPFSVAYAFLVVIWLIVPDLPLNAVHGFTFNKTPIVSTLFLTLIHSTSLYALYYRYSNATDLKIRRQMKWIVYGLTIAFVATFLRYLILALLGPDGLLQFGVQQTDWFFKWTVLQIQRMLLIIVPITFGIAILRDNLWNIDFIINRTLLYGCLSAIVVSLYIVVVGALSAFFQSRFNNLLISLIGTGCIAILFTPIKNLLDKNINRFLYGDRDNPFVVLSDLARQLEGNQEPIAAFFTVVNSIGRSLKLPYVAIKLNRGKRKFQEENMVSEVIAEFGTRTQQFHSFPLKFQGDVLGQLLVSPRNVNETFSEPEAKLLANLASQTGIVAHNYQLFRDLSHARERLIMLREEEKKKMRQDLHDSLGPQLAILYTNLTAVKRHQGQLDPKIVNLIDDALTHVSHAKKEVRVLVDDLRPPNLDELGLINLIKIYLESFGSSGIIFDFDYSKPIPTLQAAAEVAIWRIVQESVNNVVKHSTATECQIKLKIVKDIQLMICDNGKGMIVQKNYNGVGLSSIRDRAEELGGTLSIETPSSGGLCLHISIPLM